MLGTVIYHSNIIAIGGVETFLYELAKLSYDNGRDLTIVYRTGDQSQIRRLKKYCRVLHLCEVKTPIRCDTAIFNYNVDAIDDFEANTYIQMVHANFKLDPNTWGLKLIQSDKISQYYAVSEAAAEAFSELTGKDVKVLYNPISIVDEPRVMTLLSAQRMCEAKGSVRIGKMARALDDAKLPYVWHIFAETPLQRTSPNIMYHPPTLDIRRWVKYADYSVLLSDSEGFAYGLYESLSLGTPIITTPLPILNELGATKDNSIIVDFDLHDMNVGEIYRRAGTFKFNYEPKSTKPWLDMLKFESTYTPPKMVTIDCTKKYFDIALDRTVELGERYEVEEERAKIIVQAQYAEYVGGQL